jgi:hypothetical protein
MALGNPVISEGYVPAYQVSSIPYVTNSLVTLGGINEHNFDTVTKSITLKNNSADTAIAVSFTLNGLKPDKGNYFVLSGTESYSGDIRTSKIFVSGAVGNASYQMLVGLTNIPISNFLILTESNGYNGVG